MKRGAFVLLLALGVPATAVSADSALPRLEATVSVAPAKQELRAEGFLTLPAGPAHTVRMAKRFVDAALREALARVRGAGAPERAGDEVVWRFAPDAERRTIALRWQGRLDPLDASLDHRDTLRNAAPVSGPAGTFLPAASGWHPSVDGGPLTYGITLRLPAGQRGLVAGRLDAESDTATGYEARFSFDQPADGIDLMAGPYTVTERAAKSVDGRDIRLRTYFVAGLEAMAPAYLDSSAELLGRFERSIGPYPYEMFSVVSSPTPTGFGMPTLTYIGADVLKLPFMREVSLGHEILHNWWGNGVFPDYRQGNWSEGLTTLLADYDTRERQGPDAARAMRLAWLRDITALRAEDDRPLTSFTSRTHGASHILGYQKTAMVLLMLRHRIGPDAFAAGMRMFWTERRFRVSSWTDLRQALESASGQDLTAFFRRWVEQPGIPSIRLERATAMRLGDAWSLQVVMTRDLPDDVATIPLQVDTADGVQTFDVRPSGARTTLSLMVRSEPRHVLLDPEMITLRRLAPDEAPPILRDVMVDRNTRLIALGPDDAYAASARDLANRMLDEPPADADPETPPSGPLLVMGLPDRVDAYAARFGLSPSPEAIRGKTGSRVWTTRTPTGVVVLIAADAENLAALARPLPHYGAQSWLLFEGRRAAARGVWPSIPQSVPVTSESPVR